MDSWETNHLLDNTFKNIYHTLLYMSSNVNNGAKNYSISKTPLNNSTFTSVTNGLIANPMKPSTTGSGSMFSLGRTSANRIRAEDFKEVIENNKYSGAKSSAERTLYLKKLSQASSSPTTNTVSYVSSDSTNKNDVKTSTQRARNSGAVVPRKSGL